MSYQNVNKRNDSYSIDDSRRHDGSLSLCLSNRDTGYDCVTIDRQVRDKNFMETNRTIDDINVALSIFRYKFTDDFMVELAKFSKIHQYDHRSTFKEAWTLWTQENEEMIHREVNRLQNMHYDGDILTKMFKSARYYFRKKSTEKKEPVDRRVYISMDDNMLQLMDQHILQNIQQPYYKPSEGFNQFCQENRDVLKDEVKKMVDLQLTKEAIEEKVKKTYKNRYFIFVKNTITKNG